MRLEGTIDATGQADVGLAVETLKEVAAKYEKLGFRVSGPITLVIEAMPIMGATEPSSSGYSLHIGAFAVRSGMLDGLIAHEMGHMIRMEAGHPSHSRRLHELVMDSIKAPPEDREAFQVVAGAALNHVEDIYADDLAFEIIGDDRAGLFFSDWVRRSAVVSKNRWQTVANEVSVAFALGNIARHAVQPNAGTLGRAKSFAAAGRIKSLFDLAYAFENLPKTDEIEPVEGAIRFILTRAVNEALHL